MLGQIPLGANAQGCLRTMVVLVHGYLARGQH